MLAPGCKAGALDDMKESQDLTQLIGDIYDAALDSSRWTSVLAKIACYAGGQAAGLLSKDSAEPRVFRAVTRGGRARAIARRRQPAGNLDIPRAIREFAAP